MHKPTYFALLGFALALSLGSQPLLAGDSSKDAAKAKDSQPKEKKKTPSWGYKGKGGPKHWAKLNPEFSLCQDGKEQSPVALTRTALKNDERAITLDYGEALVKVSRKEKPLTYFLRSRHYVELEEKTYRLIQFHFHWPSEHTLDGLYTPLELHFVHKSKEGENLVLGVFIKAGPETHREMEQLIDSVESREKVYVELESLLPAPGRRDFFYYMGSRSTPPCKEGVHWIMLEHSIKISENQIEALQRLMPKTQRPLQKLYKRKFIKIDQ